MLIMRVLIYGNAPWCPSLSGYGTQAALLGRILRKAGYEIAYSPFHGLQGVPLQWEGFPVFPGSSVDPWALDLLPAHYRHFGADLLITLMDAWVLNPAAIAGLNVAHWLPADCERLSALDRRMLDAGGHRPIAMSRFGEAQMKAAGYDALYAPHALDMRNVWKALEDRDEVRKQLGLDGKFVILVNAANQDPDRKGLSEQFDAFTSFAARHDDAVMLVHTRAETPQGANLPALISALGMDGRILLSDQYQVAAGLIGEDQMARWHCVGDVLSNCAWGEGFGLAVLQSQACGTPVIVTDCSAMTELCGSGWKVPGQRKWNKGHQAWWTIPFVTAIGKAYEKAYLKARDPAMREKARRFALAYDADRVYAEHWEPVLKELLPAARPVPEPALEAVPA